VAKVRIKSVYLFMNRNCLVFDENGEQVAKYQRAIGCYRLNKKLAKELAAKAETFYLSKWQTWCHEIDRRSFEYLLGLRTKADDLAERNPRPAGPSEEGR
jgi:hypothetical protein